MALPRYILNSKALKGIPATAFQTMRLGRRYFRAAEKFKLEFNYIAHNRDSHELREFLNFLRKKKNEEST